jgi:hypothetical protein
VTFGLCSVARIISLRPATRSSGGGRRNTFSTSPIHKPRSWRRFAGSGTATARGIPNGNEEAWLKSWSATADRVANIAETSLRQGHRVSAREAFLRASNYYRTAEFFRRRDPANDPEVVRLSDRSRETFVVAAKLLGTPSRSLRSHMKIRLFPANRKPVAYASGSAASTRQNEDNRATVRPPVRLPRSSRESRSIACRSAKAPCATASRSLPAATASSDNALSTSSISLGRWRNPEPSATGRSFPAGNKVSDKTCVRK